MIRVDIQMRATAPDTFAVGSEQQRLIDMIEALVQAEGFDDTDTTFNQTGQDVTPPGTVLFRLQEGRIQVGKNGATIKCDVLDPAEFRLASKNDNLAFFGVSALRSDDTEELLGFILVKRWEAMRHLGELNLFSEMQYWIRDPRRGASDDIQFVKGWGLAPDGLHFHMPIWLHGQPVAGAIAEVLGVTLPKFQTPDAAMVEAEAASQANVRQLAAALAARMRTDPALKGMTSTHIPPHTPGAERDLYRQGYEAGYNEGVEAGKHPYPRSAARDE